MWVSTFFYVVKRIPAWRINGIKGKFSTESATPLEENEIFMLCFTTTLLTLMLLEIHDLQETNLNPTEDSLPTNDQ